MLGESGPRPGVGRQPRQPPGSAVEALAGGRGVDRRHSETVGDDMLYVAVPIVDGERVVGVARTALPLSQVDSLVDELVRALLLAAAGAGLLALCAALLAARLDHPPAERRQPPLAAARRSRRHHLPR